jgi:hypothetical protein
VLLRRRSVIGLMVVLMLVVVVLLLFVAVVLGSSVRKKSYVLRVGVGGWCCALVCGRDVGRVVVVYVR